MPAEVIKRVNRMARRSRSGLTFGDNYNNLDPSSDDDEEDDPDYVPGGTDIELDDDDSEDDDTSNEPDDDPDNPDEHQPQGVNPPSDVEEEHEIIFEHVEDQHVFFFLNSRFLNLRKFTHEGQTNLCRFFILLSFRRPFRPFWRGVVENSWNQAHVFCRKITIARRIELA